MPTLTTRQQRAAAERRRNSWKAALALLAALLLHLILLPIIVWVASHWPKAPLKGVPPRAPIRLTLLPPEATPGPANQPTAPYMRTTDEQKADQPVVDPNFISDHDTTAKSELPATGDQPLPSQDGRKSDDFEFSKTNYRPGPTPSEAASAAPAAAAQKLSEAGKQNEAPAPSATPLPTKHRAPRKNSDSTPSPEGELATAEPTASPEPPAPTPEKAEDLAANVPPADTRMQSRTAPSNQSTASLVPNPGLPKPPGYQKMTQPTVFKGSINNRGKSAVAAIGTPLGRYFKNIEDSIGALWYFRTDEKMDVLSVSQVTIHFVVDSSGRARQVKVIKGSGNSALATVSIGSVMDADIPPIPPELLNELPGGQMEMEMDFGIE